jgi:hypothetical protein
LVREIRLPILGREATGADADADADAGTYSPSHAYAASFNHARQSAARQPSGGIFSHSQGASLRPVTTNSSSSSRSSSSSNSAFLLKRSSPQGQGLGQREREERDKRAFVLPASPVRLSLSMTEVQLAMPTPGEEARAM